eukprot:PhF_6_TR43328/c0_g1_i3/m.66235
MFFTPFHLKAEREVKTTQSQENQTITKSNSDENDPLLKKLYIPAEVVAKYTTTTVPSTPVQHTPTATPTPTVFKSKVKNTKYSYEVMIPSPSSSNTWQTAIITTPIP